ncbi:ras GTPase-activating protein-binding protein 2 isoform X2 [Bacillus rossius redtenbacheri]|uniref:ras GTPase-activating protein-binding protein 2 isoform X2 n=1 Tax=Bacillus rossius redtenbacheri TaxID=93214 RepID=UPI002FDE1D5E
MVMETPPSPQCVGREFVRQYYTLLNQAPAHLHRFYNNNSSFIHGGLDLPNREAKPVVGQKQIHQKIQQLNFRDCHAKISQVDSQATLGDGVVVQVTGELSNCGQPMRRFTQTFVLAAQSPKKYYVHNDIFRYQDIIFSDEEMESSRSEAEEEQEPEHSPPADAMPPNQPMVAPQPAMYYSPASNPPAVVNGSAHPEEVMVAAPALPATPLPLPQPALQPMPPPQVVMSALHPPVGLPPPEPQAEEEEQGDEEGQGDEEAGPQEGPEEEEAEAADAPEQLAVAEDADKEAAVPLEGLDEAPHLGETVSNEPKTYATLVKSGGIGNIGPPSFASTLSTSPTATTKPTTSPLPAPRVFESRDSLSSSGAPGGGPMGMAQSQRGVRGARGGAVRGVMRNDRGGPGRTSFNEDSDGDRRRSGPNTQMYLDSQQLFLGNLPHNATEDDLKQLFGKFGTVIDIRIHSKPNNKNMPGNRVPNYGFITFEDSETALTVLSSRPIMFPDENGQKMKLNVEEKKNRPRQLQDGGRMLGGDGSMGGGRPSGGGMGGPRPMGPGMMRGGPGMGHRGGSRGFSRGDGRGGGMSRGGGTFTRR